MSNEAQRRNPCIHGLVSQEHHTSHESTLGIVLPDTRTKHCLRCNGTPTSPNLVAAVTVTISLTIPISLTCSLTFRCHYCYSYYPKPGGLLSQGLAGVPHAVCKSVYIRILADVCSIHGLTKLQRHMNGNIWDLSKIGSSHSTITVSIQVPSLFSSQLLRNKPPAADTERQGKLAVFRCFFGFGTAIEMAM